MAAGGFDAVIGNPPYVQLSEVEGYSVDHYTCVESRTHHSDPVPFLIYDSAHELKGPEKFSEKTAAQSKIVVSEGHYLIESFLRSEAFAAGKAA